MNEQLMMSAAALGRGIEAGEIDPRALVELFLDAIAQHEHGDRIYVRPLPARARAEAAAAADRAKRGLRRGPLDGVPISLKDLFDVAGVETEAGSRLTGRHRADRDATVVMRLTRAGLVSLGKTHMSELAFSGLGVNPNAATPPNARDPDRAPGGSSSGAAASIAWGLAPLALGSDTGGSVRIPAAWNDLVGLKTTAGLIPLDGVTPLSPTLDTIGPLARTVEDAALVLPALTDGRPVDLEGASLRGCAFLAPEGVALEGLVDEVRTTFEAAFDRLARAGAKIERQAAPELAETLEIAARDGAVVNTEGYAIWGEAIEARPDAIWAPIRDRFRSGAGLDAARSDGARFAFRRLAARWADRVAPFDAAVLPTTPNVPPPIARAAEDPAFHGAQNLLALRNTRLANLLGLSSLTVPTASPWRGLMLFGRPGDEARLLRLGRAIETAFGEG